MREALYSYLKTVFPKRKSEANEDFDKSTIQYWFFTNSKKLLNITKNIDYIGKLWYNTINKRNTVRNGVKNFNF